ncbi:SDR family NAD(P)-dependent oxidoreductase [Micromonospora sp. URMC 106]|uniref:SDR family NAD(P)-dependent oxidoreductase n=1 Tax=Micromonospora sp. URMC 106 TaxID=3423408 RepID=UPI003F1AEF59
MSWMVPIGAADADALRRRAAEAADRLAAGAEPTARDAPAGAAHRLVAAGGDRASLVAALRSAAAGEPTDGVRTATGVGAPRLAMVFSGEGTQWPGMGDGLSGCAPYADALDRCDAAVRALGGWSVVEEIRRPAAASRLAETAVAQPAIVAVEIGLLALLDSLGVRPDVVIGHSLGEITAAHAAGALSVEDAMAVAYHQGRMLQRATGGGGMLAVGLSAEQATRLLADLPPGLSLAAVNGPASVVLSGERSALDAAVARLAADRVFHRDLGINYAFHSPQMEPFTGELVADLRPLLRNGPTTTDMVSTVHGDLVGGDRLGAEHWGMLSRRPVRFLDAVARAGAAVHLEVSPTPVLRTALLQCLGGRVGTTVLGSLRPDRDAAEAVHALAADLYLAGLPVSWDALPAVSRATAGPAGEPERVSVGSSVVDRLRAGSPAGLGHRVREYVVDRAAEVLGRDRAEIPADAGLFALGFDSLTAVRLAERLAADLRPHVAVGPTVAFDHPSVADLVAHLTARLGGGDADRSATGPAATPTGPGRALAADEPIAVVGMACRVPGADGPDEFWRLLRDGVDATGPVPRDRWDVDALHGDDPLEPGTIYARRGGFLPTVDTFDADFFGISAVEAESMDPQQRLLLEVAWEALEHAGMPADRLRGTRSGVFAGLSIDDYKGLQIADPARIDGYTGTGNLFCVAAGRLSYVLGLRGPSMAVDTGCSSSLVTVHLAAQALRAGECDLALAGGAHLMLAPDITLFLCRAGALAPDGRCKTFDAAADGYSRGEGAGMVVLKRLSDAIADGDDIHAVLAGSAVNHDGASSGLTVPNGTAQQELLTDALRAAGLAPADVDYLEAHGTGTPLGDPIELRAAADVLGRDRRDPLVVGSVKTNIGHLEAAAGVVGLIKTVLALRHRWIPAHLNFRTPNPRLPWDELPLSVATTGRPWPAGPDGRPRVAGVSSFGIGGTNAHVLLAEHRPATAPALAPAAAAGPAGSADRADAADHADPAGPDGGDALLLPLSAGSPAALRALAGRYAAHLDRHPELSASAVCAAAARFRAPLRHRLAVTGADRAELRHHLDRYARGQADDPISGEVRAAPRIAFVFPGQGCQYPGMGRELYDTEPVFRAALRECADILGEHLGDDLVRVLHDGGELLHRTGWTQPAVVAVEYALARLWGSWGLEPAVVLGHSVGEYAAACVAGVLPLEQALRLVAVRARLMDALPAGGRMLAVAADGAATEAVLAGHPDVSVAAYNGPAETVVSGPAAAVESVARALADAGVRHRDLRVSHAFHSALMDPVRAGLAAEAARSQPTEPRVDLVSTVTGRLLDGPMDADYWCRNAREPVRFAEAVGRLAELDCGLVLELGPDPVLGTLARRGALVPRGARWVPTMRRGRADAAVTRDALGAAFCAGAPLAWERVHPDARRVPLPTYPFQRRRFWRDTRLGASRPADTGPLGERLRSPALTGSVFEQVVGPELPERLTDHGLFGASVVSAANHLAAILAASAADGVPSAEVTDVTFPEPLTLTAGERVQIQVLLGAPDGPARAAEVVSAAGGDPARWRVHATGTVRPAGPAPAGADRPRDTPGTEVADLEERMHAAGYRLGPRYRWLESVVRHGDEADATLRRPRVVPPSTRPEPGLLDSCLRLVLALAPQALATDGGGLAVPVGVDRLAWYAPGPSATGDDDLTCRARLRSATPDGDDLVLDVTLRAAGRVRLVVDGLRLRRVRRDALLRGGDAGDRLRHRIDWRPADPAPQRATGDTTGGWLLLADAGGVADRVAAAVRDGGGTCRAVGPAAAAEHPGGLPALLAEPGPEPLRGVALLWPLDDGPGVPGGAAALHDRQAHGAHAALHLLHAQAARHPGARLVLVTRGCQQTDDTAPVDPTHAAVWGLGRVAMTERPDADIVLLDLPPDGADPAADAAAVLAALTAPAPPPQQAVRPAGTLAPRLVPAPADRPESLPVDPDGGYLVTGGTGGLGRRVAAWLLERGAGRVWLLSRGATTVADAEPLPGEGDRVRTLTCDVTDPVALDLAVAAARRAGPPLRGVVHAAGGLDDAPLGAQTPDRLDNPLRPKLAAAQLHLATLHDQLDFFVLFSSLAGVVGTAGQAGYAAGNAFLDALAGHRRALGLPAVSIAWGPWAETGMAARLGARERDRLTAFGLHPLDPATGLDVLAGSAAGPPCLVVADADWSRLAGHLPQRWRPGLYAELVDVAPVTPVAGPGTGRPHRAPESPREQILAEIWAEIFRVDRVGVTDNFFDLGGDSILSLRLVGAARRAGLRIAEADVFAHPTVRDLAAVAADDREAEDRDAGERANTDAVPAPGEHPPGERVPAGRGRRAPADLAAFADAGLDASDLTALAAQLAGATSGRPNGRPTAPETLRKDQP